MKFIRNKWKIVGRKIFQILRNIFFRAEIYIVTVELNLSKLLEF